MASAPPPSDDALPTYEEAVTAGRALNTSGTRSYDSLPRSRANTGDYVVQYPVKTGEDEDVETALLKAELQRLRQENLEAKKQLLRQEIENERMKAGSASNVYPYSSATTIPAPQPSSSAIIPVRPLPPPDPEETEAGEEDSCNDGKNRQHQNFKHPPSYKHLVILIAISLIITAIFLIIFAR